MSIRRFVYYDRRFQSFYMQVAGQKIRLKTIGEPQAPTVQPLQLTVPYFGWWAAPKEVEPLTTGSTYLWSQVSGPGTITFDDTSFQKPLITASVAGKYVIRCLIDGSTQEDFGYWALDFTEMMTRVGYIRDPSTIPANDEHHPPGPFNYGQVDLADVNTTGIDTWHHPSVDTWIETNESIQGIINNANNGSTLGVRARTITDADLSVVNLQGRTLNLVGENGTRFSNVSVRGQQGGLQKLYNLEFDGFTTSAQNDPMVWLAPGSHIVHCNLFNSPEVNFRLENNIHVVYSDVYRGRVYNFNGNSKTGFLLKFSRFREGNYGLIEVGIGVLANDGRSKHDPKVQAGGCKISQSNSFVVESNHFDNNAGADLWLDWMNYNALIRGNVTEGQGAIGSAGNYSQYASFAMEGNNVVGAASRNVLALNYSTKRKDWVWKNRDGANIWKYNFSDDNDMPYNNDTTSRVGSINEVTEFFGNKVNQIVPYNNGDKQGLYREYIGGPSYANKISISDEDWHLLTGSSGDDWAKIAPPTVHHTVAELIARSEFSNITVAYDL